MATATQSEVNQVYDEVPLPSRGGMPTQTVHRLNEGNAIEWLAKKLPEESWQREYRRVVNPLSAMPSSSAFSLYKRQIFGEVNVRAHHWKLSRTILVGEQASKRVFKHLLQKKHFSAPTARPVLDACTPVYDGMIDVLISDNPIMKFVDDPNLAIWNVTLPRHDLFPGWVKMWVEHRGSDTVVAAEGWGLGNWAKFNELGSKLIFTRGLDDLALELLGVPLTMPLRRNDGQRVAAPPQGRHR